MAQESQEFPPWLTQVVTTLTDAEGIPTETATSVLYLPLTYYGPSIPLGPDWTYGGLTSPASTSEPTSPTTNTSPTTTVTVPTSITSSPPTTSSFPSTISSSSQSTLLPSGSITSGSSSGFPSPTGTGTMQNAALPRGQLIGIIIGAILGFAFIIVLIVVSLLCYNASQKRRHRQIIDDYHFVEHSPRASGEEADPFLTRSRSQGGHPNPPMTEMGIAGTSGAGVAGGAGVVSLNSQSVSSNGTSTTGSGYGSVLAHPTVARPSTPLAAANHRHILSREELLRLSEEELVASPSDSAVSLRAVPTNPFMTREELLPLMPPPRPVEARSPSRNSLLSQASAAEAELMTAKRIKAEDLQPRTPLTQNSELPSPVARNISEQSTETKKRESWKLPGWLGVLPIGGAASSGPQRHEEEGLLSREPLQPPPPIPRLMASAGERPLSSVSGKSAASGSTIYHDAHDSPYSSSRGTPDLQAPNKVIPRPSSATEMGYRRPATNIPSSSNLRRAHTPPASFTGTPSPQAYDDNTLSSLYSNTPTSHAVSGDVDILDLPVPRPEPSFGSLKDSSVGHSSQDDHTKKWPYPPGLGLVSIAAWDDTEGKTPSPGSYVASLGRTESHLDLDEVPPAAGENWRALARSGVDPDQGRRTTFGLAPMVRNTDYHSEVASIHTHLSPSGTGSMGSNHARDHTGSSGSTSSRKARSMLSAHSNTASFSSDSHGRNRSIRGPGALSPVFGQPLSAATQEPYRAQSSPPPVPSLPFSVKPENRVGIAPPAPVVTRRDNDLDMPWASGLTENWSPT